MLRRETVPLSYIRFFHALPINYSIDIYIDNKLVFGDVLYEDFTDYVSLPSGEHTIHITRPKNPIVIYTTLWSVPEQRIYTCVIAPKTKDNIGIEFYKIEDILRSIPSNNLLIRFGHFSMNTPTIDAFLSDDNATFKKVSCSEMTNYISLKPTLYTLEINDSKTDKHLVSAPHIRLKPSRFYSIYTIGNGSKDFPLITVLSLDGNSYLKL